MSDAPTAQYRSSGGCGWHCLPARGWAGITDLGQLHRLHPIAHVPLGSQRGRLRDLWKTAQYDRLSNWEDDRIGRQRITASFATIG